MSVTITLVLSDSEEANLRIVADRLGWSTAKVQREALKDFSVKVADDLRKVNPLGVGKEAW